MYACIIIIIITITTWRSSEQAHSAAAATAAGRALVRRKGARGLNALNVAARAPLHSDSTRTNASRAVERRVPDDSHGRHLTATLLRARSVWKNKKSVLCSSFARRRVHPVFRKNFLRQQQCAV